MHICAINTDSNFYVHAWNASGEYDSKRVASVIGNYEHGLSYCDIELPNATSAINVIVKYCDTEWTNWNQTQKVSLPAFGGEDVVWMNSGGYWEEGRDNRQATPGTTNGFSASELATILADYYTCSAANTNGYNAIPQLETNFFAKCDDAVLTSSTAMTDFNWPEYNAEGKSYEGLTKNTATTLENKIAKMRAVYNANK